MNFQELSNKNAFIEGSDLWIIPGGEDQAWQNHLDWYLNYRLSNTETFEKKSISESLEKIIKDEELELVSPKTESSCKKLLVGEHYFPCKYFVQINNDNIETWFDEIKASMNDLKCKRPRIFVPTKLAKENFFQLAKGHLTGTDEVSFVMP